MWCWDLNIRPSACYVSILPAEVYLSYCLVLLGCGLRWRYERQQGGSLTWVSSTLSAHCAHSCGMLQDIGIITNWWLEQAGSGPTGSFLPLPPRDLQDFLGLWPHYASVCLCLHGLFCVMASSPSALLRSTLGSGLRD